MVPAGVTFTVTSTADLPDASPGDGRCRTSAGTCTLRAAVQEANRSAAKDTINLPAGTFKLTRVGQDATASKGDLDITGQVLISGAGNTRTIIDANGATTSDRAFDITSGAGAVTIRNLAIRNGKASASLQPGGAVRVDGAAGTPWLTLSSVVISASSGDLGGAIEAFGSRLTITGSVIKGSTSPGGWGGGIAATDAAVTITGTTISGNTASMGAGISQEGGDVNMTGVTIASNAASVNGGGYYAARTNDHPTAALEILASTIRANTAGGDGAGLHLETTADISQSTFDGNTAAGTGGGIAIRSGTDTGFRLLQSTVSNNWAAYGGGIDISGAPNHPEWQSVVNTTLAANTAAIDGGGLRATSNSQLALFSTTVAGNHASGAKSATRRGGGVFNGDNSIVHLRNTILSGNYTSNLFGSTASDCFNEVHTIDSQGWNLVGSLTSCSLSGTTFGNITGVDPLLAPLAKDGARTATRELLPGSPAIDTGETSCTEVNGSSLLVDQVGAPRPSGTKCDIGASEVATTWVVQSNDYYDGYLAESGETTGVGGALNSTAGTFRLGDTASRRQYRAVLDFITTLPAGAVVVRARLKIRESGQTGTVNPFTSFGALRVDSHSGSFGTRPLALGDFSAAGSSGVGTMTVTPVDGWHTAGIPVSLINTSGTMQFRLRFTLDDNNDALASFMSFYAGEASDANCPVLEIEYYIAA